MINVTGCKNRAAGHMCFTTEMPLAGKYLFSQLQGPNSEGEELKNWREELKLIIWYYF